MTLSKESSSRSHIVPHIVFLAPLEVIYTQKLAKISKTLIFDLEMWPFLTLKVTSNVVENDNIARAILKNPYIVPKIVSLAPLEVI